MVIGEFFLSNEMISEGVEAMREAKVRCLTEAEMVVEVYMAMAGQALLVTCNGEATVQ
jgi:hypothetical protein